MILKCGTRPTRFDDDLSSLIDHIYTNKPDDTSIAGILASDVSEHLPIVYISKTKVLSSKPTFQIVTSRQITDANINKIRNEFSLMDWSEYHQFASC